MVFRRLSLLALLSVAGLAACAKSEPGPRASERATDHASSAKATASAASNALGAPSDRALSKASARLVHELPAEMRLDFYITRTLPHGEAFTQSVSELLSRYAEASRGGDGVARFNFHVIDPSTEDAKAAAEDGGVHETTVGEPTASGGAHLEKGFSGVVLKYANEAESIPFWPLDTRGLELELSGKIDQLRRTVEHHARRVGVVVGKGGVQLSDDAAMPMAPGKRPDFRHLITDNFPSDEIVDVDLKNGAAPIEEGLRALLVMQPHDDFSDAELERLDEFVMRGDTALAIVASAVNVEAGDLNVLGHLGRHGLERLLSGYGVSLGADAVFDPASGWALANPGGTGPNPVIFSWLPELHGDSDGQNRRLDDSFFPFLRLPSAVLPFSSSLTLHPDVQPETRMRVVARTSPAAIVSTAQTIDFMQSALTPPTGEGGARVLGVVLEPGCCDGSTHCGADDPCRKGLIHSAFPTGSGGTSKASAKASRILIVSSAQLFANPFARASNLPVSATKAKPDERRDQLQIVARPYAARCLTSSLLALKGTLDWLAADPDMAELARADEQALP